MDDKVFRRIFSNLPVIETERLVLKKIAPENLYDMYDYACLSETSRYLLWSPHLNLDETKGHIAFLQKQYRKGLCGEWGVNLKNGVFIGTVGFAQIDRFNNKAEIGYVLSPKYRKQGLMREAVNAVFELGFRSLGLNRIEARILVGNEASERLATAVGMSFEGILRNSIVVKGEYKSYKLYSILAKEYLEAKGPAVWDR